MGVALDLAKVKQRGARVRAFKVLHFRNITVPHPLPYVI
jgi:hypothetical protein